MISFILLTSSIQQVLIKHLLSTGQKDKWDIDPAFTGFQILTELVLIPDFLSYISPSSSKKSNVLIIEFLLF